MILTKPEAAETEENPEKLQRVAMGLYRRKSSGRYYAAIRRGGKLFRESLKTTDRQMAACSSPKPTATCGSSILRPWPRK